MGFLLTGFTKASLLLLSIVTSAGALADWDLDSQRSTVQFMSIKNGSIAELHHFKSVSGAISEGSAQVQLDLDSVETLVPIRNERLRAMLFETARFPAATLAATVPDAVNAMQTGDSMSVQTTVTVSLHGVDVPYEALLQVTRLAGADLMVALSEPLLVKAGDFGLEGGIQALREVAGLKSISTSVPVSGQLMFTIRNN